MIPSPKQFQSSGKLVSGLWLGTSTVHSLVILHNKDAIFYFISLLVNLGRYRLTSTISIAVLLVELVVIKHGRHVVPCSYWQPHGGCFDDDGQTLNTMMILSRIASGCAII